MTGFSMKTRMTVMMLATLGVTLDLAGDFLYWFGWRLVWAGLGLNNLAKRNRGVVKKTHFSLDSKVL